MLNPFAAHSWGLVVSFWGHSPPIFLALLSLWKFESSYTNQDECMPVNTGQSVYPN